MKKHRLIVMILWRSYVPFQDETVFFSGCRHRHTVSIDFEANYEQLCVQTVKVL